MDILEYIKSKNKYIDAIKSFNTHGNIYIGNATTNIAKMLCATSFLNANRPHVYICESIYEASKAYETMCDLVGSEHVSFFPMEEFISSELVASSLTFRLARMMTLHNIIEQKNTIIVTSTEGVTKQMMSKARLESSIINLKVNDIIEIKELVNELVARGYKKTSITDELGSFSVRGSIIDIYPINEDTVYRINFFDNEIDSIKKVNIETQMSVGKVNKVEIFPLYEMYYEEKDIPQIISKIKAKHKETSKVTSDIEKIKNYESLDQLYIYLPSIDENYTPFINLINNPICFYDDLSNIITHENVMLKEISEYLLDVKYENTNEFFLSIKDIIALSKTNVIFEPYFSSLHDIKLTKLIDLHTIASVEYNNNIRTVINDIKLNINKTYIITHEDENKLRFLIETFTSNDVKYKVIKDFKDISLGKVNLIVSHNATGFIDTEENVEILTPNEFAPGKINRTTKYKKYYKHSSKIYNKDDLKSGDYVVHQDYGIGEYVGIETRVLRGNKYDFLKIKFAEDSSLLVPIENIYLLEKYNTTKDAVPKLNNLSGKEWKKKKARIKEKVMEVATRLIKVQAERETKQGYIYKPDTVDQQIFESDFEFAETPDQIKAIEEVKKDMESPRPLDRLICGDVGFGKTEVAMRAAFKAVENNKQVAYLAPTTVLTRQHYQTFKERFEKYGVRVELLNRFVPQTKQKEILKGLEKGYVDIIIGTHRILSKDIIFKDLGLLVIDEEQRFGVLHKERIKEMKANVDVLTLTATPIPRTLQMSLSGLRDLSLIETPPSNRLPIQTYVLEVNDSVIREAINRELGRKGQVFYLLNRIDELDRIVAKIKRLTPIAKIGVIHGQMDKEEIENQLEKFLEGTYNVLVCTTIIETGIDIPNANTLIIERADYLGLSQLYQIRGRVGRSDRISYAYLMYEKEKILTENAVRRLNAIKEFTSLGSGYKIAMKDLAIRGAGDILGDEQSGFIDAIGMDLYMKLLNEAIDEIKGKTKEEDKHYNINVSKHVDEAYVSDEDIRITIHKDICKIKSRKELSDLKQEFTDRYGELSEQILLYMEEKYLEFLLKSHGVESFKETSTLVTFSFDEATCRKLDLNSLTTAAKLYGTDFNFKITKTSIIVEIPLIKFNKSYIYTLTKFLENITFITN